MHGSQGDFLSLLSEEFGLFVVSQSLHEFGALSQYRAGGAITEPDGLGPLIQLQREAHSLVSRHGARRLLAVQRGGARQMDQQIGEILAQPLLFSWWQILDCRLALPV